MLATAWHMPPHALRSLVSVTANDAGQHNCIHDKAITRVRSVYFSTSTRLFRGGSLVFASKLETGIQQLAHSEGRPCF